MRAGSLAIVALVAAAIGATAVLVVASAAGWVGEERQTTVYVRAPAGGEGEPIPVATGPAAKPLAGNGFDPARIYAERSPGVVTIHASFGAGDALGGDESQGSGFVVSPEGYILTNSHVITTAGEVVPGEVTPVARASRVYVTFRDGDRIPAAIVGYDLFNDIGVIRVAASAHKLRPVPLGDSRAVVVGEPVAAIGSPFGNESSLAVGIIAATGRSVSAIVSRYNIVDALQTDAPINRGNSGGPLFDARGRVVGINAQIRSESGNAEGVGFAIPINSARRSLEQLIDNGRVAYAFVGIETDDMTPRLARRLGLKVLRGALVRKVSPGTPAARAGLREGMRDEELNGQRFRVGGDIIVAIDGAPVRGSEDVLRILTSRLLPGQVAQFTVFRDGSRRTIPVKLAERPSRS